MNANRRLAPAVDAILSAARAREPPDGGPIDVDARPLPEALAAAEADGRVPIVAEVKPTSPTTDGERDDDPVELARRMIAGGAAAVSVLTEPEHFGGSPEALRRVREAVDVPVLRKDFVLDERELDRVAADAVLVIARFVDPVDLGGLIAAARERGMVPLVEVHTRDELSVAVASGAELVGVNNRDLRELSVDLSTVEQVAPAAPDEVTLIAESGIGTPEDVRRMRRAGADGLLVGSAVMGHAGPDAGDVEANTRRLVEATDG